MSEGRVVGLKCRSGGAVERGEEKKKDRRGKENKRNDKRRRECNLKPVSTKFLHVVLCFL
jgi:hypothetical protein